MSSYDEIINLPHFEPKKHPRMSRYMRAAQFSSFAALTGYDDDIFETARLTDERIELEEYDFEILNRKIRDIIDCQKQHPEVTLKYFKSDEKKPGGSYITEKVTVRIADEINRFIETTDRKIIHFDDIIQIEKESTQ